MPSNFQNSLNTTRELKGKPGQNWLGPVVVPARGSMVLKINSTILEAKKISSFGLEQAEAFIRIQQIDTIEMVEGRLWWLLSLAFFFAGAYFNGGAFGMICALIAVGIVVAFFVVKQKWMVIRTGSTNVILFYKNSGLAKEFSSNLLAIACKLNTQPAPTQSRDRQRSRQQPTRNGGQQNPQRKSPQRQKNSRTGAF